MEPLPAVAHTVIPHFLSWGSRCAADSKSQQIIPFAKNDAGPMGRRTRRMSSSNIRTIGASADIAACP